MSAVSQASPESILLVEDYPLDALLIAEMLEALPEPERPALKHVSSVAEAEAELAGDAYDCVLLDLGLPDGEGVENVQRIRAASPRAAIVVMTGLDDEQRAIESLRLGAQEYLVKGRVDPAELMRHLRHALQRHGLVVDLDREHAQQKRLAGHDPLTGLLNRQSLSEHARAAMAQAQDRRERLGLCFLDLDGFKSVNDQLGHAAGDAVLVDVARALRAVVRGGDLVARLGGDEFVVLLSPLHDEAEALDAGARLVAAVRAVRPAANPDLALDVSVGAAIYPDHGQTLEQLLLHADALMYRVKREGGGDVRLQAQPPTPAPPPARASGDALRDAGLFYQPWVCADGGEPGVEALLRERREGRWTTAEHLLDRAQRMGARSGLSRWVLQTACRQWAQWMREGGTRGRIAVNMSAAEVAQPEFAQLVSEVLAAEALPHRVLQIEIAEQSLDAPTATLLANLDALRAQGVHVVLDRFGHGAASLRTLVELPIDGVKLDPQLVAGLGSQGSAARAMLAGIAAAASQRGLPLVAVGVEAQAQAQACLELSCHRLQGLWLAAPVEGRKLPALLREAAQRERQARLDDLARPR